MKKKKKRKTYESKEMFWSVVKYMVECFEKEEGDKLLTDAFDISVGYKIEDLDFEYSIVLKCGNIEIVNELVDSVDILIKADSQVFHDVNTGKLDTIKALITRKIRFEKGGMEHISLAGTFPIAEYYKKSCEYNEIA